MTTLTQELIDRGLSLPPAERERFAHLLLDSVANGGGYTEEELHAELDRRLDDFVSGKESSLPGEQFLAELRARVARGKTG